MSKKKTELEQDLLALGVSTRIREIRQSISKHASENPKDESALAQLKKLVEEFEELLQIKENL